MEGILGISGGLLHLDQDGEAVEGGEYPDPAESFDGSLWPHPHLPAGFTLAPKGTLRF